MCHLTRTSRNQKGNVFFDKKKFSAVRENLDDPPIHVPQNVPALAGLNEITFVGSSPYGAVICNFYTKKFNLHQNLVRKCKDLAGKILGLFPAQSGKRPSI
jgi:hypothetical protein